MLPLLQRLSNLVQDPPPDYVIEISESGLAYARPAAGAVPAFQPLEPGVLAVSPLVDNVLKPDALADAIRVITGPGSGRKRGRAVLILPDYSARVAVLSFDQFPTDVEEQRALVRFRMKKSVPFDVETAALSHYVQSPGKRGAEVVVVVAALEIVARYEAALRSAGLHPGLVTTSGIAMAELASQNGISILARLSGRQISVLVTNGGALKLVRTVEMANTSADEITGVLFPTLAYVEDELGAHADRLSLCGFGDGGRLPEWVADLQIPVEPLRSRLGVPGGNNAGLLGYLESVSRGAKAA